MTEPVHLPTRREFAASKGLAVSAETAKANGRRPGGRLSKAALQAIDEARANGQRFADDK